MRERLLLALLIALTVESTPMPLRGQSAPGWLEPYREPAARLIGFGRAGAGQEVR